VDASAHRAGLYNTLDYWVELAQLLERGKFDALFLADVLGVYDVYRRVARRGDRAGSPDAGQRSAAADSGDGIRHPKSRLRGYLRGLL